MKKQYILAHDIGTSGNKASLYDQEGKILSSTYQTYETWFDKDGYAEQSPEDWWEAIKNTSKKVIVESGVPARDVVAMSFSSQSCGCIPIDEQGNVLTDKVMIWMDNRATAEAEEILNTYGERRHYETTGASFHAAAFPCSKIMWLRRHEPEVYNKTFKFIGVKDYIIMKLTGKFGVTDYTEASFSGMLDIHTHEFDQELMDIVGVDRSRLCELKESTTVIGTVKPELESETGLTPDCKVMLGMIDNVSCSIGGGCMDFGTFVINLGTAAWIGVSSDKPLMSPNFKSNCIYVGNGVYYTSMHSHSACASYDWVLNNLLAKYENNFDLLADLASKVPPGSDKLFFLPSFSSGNSLYTSSDMGGAFIGMRLHHDTGNIVRAVMEWVGFDLMMAGRFFEEIGVSMKKIRIVGGGSKSYLWRQMLADMLNVEIEVPEGMQHIGTLGAAVAGGIGSGIFDDYRIIDHLVKASSINTPDKEAHEQYMKLLPIFKQCYENLMPVFDRFSDI